MSEGLPTMTPRQCRTWGALQWARLALDRAVALLYATSDWRSQITLVDVVEDCAEEVVVCTQAWRLAQEEGWR